MHIGGGAGLRARAAASAPRRAASCARPPSASRSIAPLVLRWRRRRVRAVARRTARDAGGHTAGRRRAAPGRPLRRRRSSPSTRRRRRSASPRRPRRPPPPLDRREFAWRTWHSGDRADRLPQRRTHDGRRRTRAAASAGTCWPASAASSRCTPTAAPPTPRAPRSRPIYGPALDGTLPGNEVIVQSRAAGRVTYARAMGPMQFLPGTWARYASDGDGDGKADAQNLLRRDAGRGPLPVQRRPEPARPVAGAGGDPALQQLDGLRPERAGLGRGLRDRRGAGRPAADHRPDPAARRCAPGQPEGLGPGLPMNALGPAGQRPAGADAAVTGPQRRGQPVPTNVPGRARPDARVRCPGRRRACRRRLAHAATAPPWLPPWLHRRRTAPCAVLLPPTSAARSRVAAAAAAAALPPIARAAGPPPAEPLAGPRTVPAAGPAAPLRDLRPGRRRSLRPRSGRSGLSPAARPDGADGTCGVGLDSAVMSQLPLTWKPRSAPRWPR